MHSQRVVGGQQQLNVSSLDSPYAFSSWQFPRLTNPNIPLSGTLFPRTVT